MQHPLREWIGSLYIDLRHPWHIFKLRQRNETVEQPKLPYTASESGGTTTLEVIYKVKHIHS